MQKLHRKRRFRHYSFLVGQIYLYFYVLVDFNHSLDSVLNIKDIFKYNGYPYNFTDVSSHHINFIHCFVLKIPLIRKFVLILFIVIRVVAAMLFIMVKLTDTFLQELLNIWVFQI